MILRRHAATADELAEFGGHFYDESTIVSETFDADAARVVVEFDMLGQWLGKSIDRPPSELVAFDRLPHSGIRWRWRSPVLRGMVTVEHAVRMRRRPGMQDPTNDIRLWAERRRSGRFLVEVGDLWVWALEVDVTVELTDEVVGESVVEDQFAANGRWAGSGWNLGHTSLGLPLETLRAGRDALRRARRGG